VLITGATSFVGISLVSHLEKIGVDVHVVVRPTTDLSRFTVFGVNPVIHVHEFNHNGGGVESLAAQLKDSDPDLIIHLAGYYVRDHSMSEVEQLVNDNILFGVQLLDAMRSANIKKFVTAGSYFQFYNSEECRPINLYAAAKQAFGDIVGYYQDAYDFRAICLVIFDTYGPLDWRPRLMAAIRKAQNTGTKLPLPAENLPIDMLYIDDLCSAFEIAANHVCSEEFNLKNFYYSVASGNDVKLNELINTFIELGKRSISLDWGAYPAQSPIVENLWNGPILPEWRARTKLVEGVKKFIEEYDGH